MKELVAEGGHTLLKLTSGDVLPLVMPDLVNSLNNANNWEHMLKCLNGCGTFPTQIMRVGEVISGIHCLLRSYWLDRGIILFRFNLF